jgi:hypothetical protein
MSTALRITTLFLAAGFTGALGLTAAPSKAADATLGRDRDVVDLAGSERWSLRPTRVTAAANLAPRPGAKASPLSDLPNERRAVRVVYQGYFDPAVSPAH